MLATVLVWFALQRLASTQIVCSNSSFYVEYYLNSSADAVALGNCGPSVFGDVYIQPSMSGDLSLDGIQTISGEVYVQNNNQLTSISSNSLSSIGYWIDVIYCSILTSLSLPNLTTIGSNIILGHLPELGTLNLGDLDVTRAESYIANQIYYTGIQTVSGIFADVTQDVSMSYNPNLNNVSLLMTQVVSQVNASEGYLWITANAHPVVYNFPNLFSTDGFIWLGDPSELSMPALALVNGTLHLQNAMFSSFEAPKLQKIIGDLTISGAFSNISFPVLNHVGGDTLITSTNALDCDALQQKYIDGGVFQGSFICEGATVPSSTQAPSSTASTRVASNSATAAKSSATSASPTYNPSPGLSGGAIAGIAIGAVAGLLLIALAAFLIMRRRRKARTAAETNRPAMSQYEQHGSPELPQGGHHERVELLGSSTNPQPGVPNRRSELRGDESYPTKANAAQVPQELNAGAVAPRTIQRKPVGSPTTSSGSPIMGHDASRISGPSELSWPETSESGGHSNY